METRGIRPANVSLLEGLLITPDSVLADKYPERIVPNPPEKEEDA